MNSKFLIIPLSFFVFACSSTEQKILTEFSDHSEESASRSNIDILPLQSKNYAPSFVSSQTTPTKNPNFRKEGKNTNPNIDQNLDNALKTFSSLNDPDKARDLINKYRKSNNLNPVKLNAALTEAAKAHSIDLSKWDRISHYGSDGSNPLDRINKTGYKARTSAENIGTGQSDFEKVFDGWTRSPGQNKNLLLPEALDMGLALVEDPKTEFKSFWTLILAAPT
ncbi:MAG: CAP domain-containing protein [Hyphomicrobium sp.]